jgi:hypothetical protein
MLDFIKMPVMWFDRIKYIESIRHSQEFFIFHLTFKDYNCNL